MTILLSSVIAYTGSLPKGSAEEEKDALLASLGASVSRDREVWQQKCDPEGKPEGYRWAGKVISFGEQSESVMPDADGSLSCIVCLPFIISE